MSIMHVCRFCHKSDVWRDHRAEEKRLRQKANVKILDFKILLTIICSIKSTIFPECRKSRLVFFPF